MMDETTKITDFIWHVMHSMWLWDGKRGETEAKKSSIVLEETMKQLKRERVTAVSKKGTRQTLTRYDVDTAATNVVAAEKGS